MPSTEFMTTRKRDKVLLIIGALVTLFFYFFNLSLPIILFCSGFPEFHWIGPYVNAVIIGWIVSAPLASIVSLRSGGYIVPLCVLAVFACVLVFRAALFPDKFWGYLLPLFAVIALIKDARRIRARVTPLGCGKHSIERNTS